MPSADAWGMGVPEIEVCLEGTQDRRAFSPLANSVALSRPEQVCSRVLDAQVRRIEGTQDRRQSLLTLRGLTEDSCCACDFEALDEQVQ